MDARPGGSSCSRRETSQRLPAAWRTAAYGAGVATGEPAALSPPGGMIRHIAPVPGVGMIPTSHLPNETCPARVSPDSGDVLCRHSHRSAMTLSSARITDQYQVGDGSGRRGHRRDLRNGLLNNPPVKSSAGRSPSRWWQRTPSRRSVIQTATRR